MNCDTSLLPLLTLNSAGKGVTITRTLVPMLMAAVPIRKALRLMHLPCSFLIHCLEMGEHSKMQMKKQAP